MKEGKPKLKWLGLDASPSNATFQLGREYGGAGDDNQENIIHSPTSLSELWDLPSNRHIVHTAFDFFSLFFFITK